jgi:hypothetical protein
MYIYRKILILAIVLITMYLLYRFLEKKQIMQTFFEKKEMENKKEGMNVTLSSKPSMTNTTNMTLSLKEYIIKASMNSAYNGSTMSIETLNDVMSHGCRFLDFEIFSVNGAPIVAYSSTGDKGNFESTNTLLLNDVIKAVSTGAFSGKAPNPEDPLFLFLRFKTSNPEIHKTVKEIIDMNMKDMLYKKEVTKDTKLSNIKQKVVIIIDNLYYLSLKNTPIVLSEFENQLLPYVNVFCGTTDFPMTPQSSILNQKTKTPQIHEDGITTDVTKWQLSIPDGMNPNNPILRPFIMDHCIQIIPYRFYLKDGELSNYEEFFSENGKVAFVSMVTAILHMKSTEHHQ